MEKKENTEEKLPDALKVTEKNPQRRKARRRPATRQKKDMGRIVFSIFLFIIPVFFLVYFLNFSYKSYLREIDFQDVRNVFIFFGVGTVLLCIVLFVGNILKLIRLEKALRNGIWAVCITGLLSAGIGFYNGVLNEKSFEKKLRRIKIEKLELVDENFVDFNEKNADGTMEKPFLTDIKPRNNNEFQLKINDKKQKDILLAYILIVSGMEKDEQGKYSFDGEVFFDDSSSERIENQNLPVITSENDWLSLRLINPLGKEKLQSVYGNLTDKIVIISVLRRFDSIIIKEGNFKLRLVVKDHINGTFSEMEKDLIIK